MEEDIVDGLGDPKSKSLVPGSACTNLIICLDRTYQKNGESQ